MFVSEVASSGILMSYSLEVGAVGTWDYCIHSSHIRLLQRRKSLDSIIGFKEEMLRMNILTLLLLHEGDF